MYEFKVVFRQHFIGFFLALLVVMLELRQYKNDLKESKGILVFWASYQLNLIKIFSFTVSNIM